MTTENTAPEQNQQAPANQAPAAPDTSPLTLGAQQAPVVPAVPVAPVVPVVDNKAAPISYEPTGDVGLDMALDFIGKAGLDSDHPAVKAAINGDFTILKATLAAKGTAGWEQFVALGEAAYERASKEAAAKSEAIREAVYKEAGGKDEWAAIQKWASDNATPEEKAEVNALLNQGGLAAKAAVRHLSEAYGRANNVTINPRDGTANASKGGAPDAANGPLSPRAYSDAVQSLNAKLGGRLEGSKEYASLQSRRAAYRGN